MSAPSTDENDWNERAYKRCQDGDRPTNEPGGMECGRCGCIFIGAEWHALCAVCLDKSRPHQ